MKVLRVINNNIVLSRDASGQEVILTGRGLGFRAAPGQEIDPARIVREFVPADGRDPDHLAELLAAIDEEVLRAVVIALDVSGVEGRATTRPTLAIAVADHIEAALERARRGQSLEYPLRAEVQTLYADEYARAVHLLAEINQRLDPPLAEHEATALALHLVNAGFASGDLSFTYTMTGVIQQLLAVASERFGIDVDSTSMSAARFITHVRYLFVRVHAHRQLDEQDSAIGQAIRRNYPEATRAAEQLATIIELRLGSHLTADEVSYLALHVARMTMEGEQGAGGGGA